MTRQLVEQSLMSVITRVDASRDLRAESRKLQFDGEDRRGPSRVNDVFCRAPFCCF